MTENGSMDHMHGDGDVPNGGVADPVMQKRLARAHEIISRDPQLQEAKIDKCGFVAFTCMQGICAAVPFLFCSCGEEESHAC